MTRRQGARVLMPLSWVAAIGAFAVVSAHATGAVDSCTSQSGYAPVPVLFWPLLAGAPVIAVVALVSTSMRAASWLSFVGVIIVSGVSLVVFGLGYSCGLGA
jgi:hypothetical protein